MLNWNGTEELEAELARLVVDHDRSWDLITIGGRVNRMKNDPETLYHWNAAQSCEAVLQDLKGPRYATLCPPDCGCRGNGK